MIDKRAIRVVLAALDWKVADLGRAMGRSRKAVSNVLTGHEPASDRFVEEFGLAIADAIFEAETLVVRRRFNDAIELFPAGPLRDAVRVYARREGMDSRAIAVGCGLDGAVWSQARLFDPDVVDRICDVIHIHPTEVYPDYYERAAS